MADPPADLVPVGWIAGAWGVQGWVRVASDTDPPEGILDYAPWWLACPGGWEAREPVEGRMHGPGLVARIEGVADRDEAARLRGVGISVSRASLPALGAGEYYWADLVGLEVVTGEGVVLGQVERLMETGANDVLIVAGKRERLVPFVEGEVVREVDLGARRLIVDWDPEF